MASVEGSGSKRQDPGAADADQPLKRAKSESAGGRALLMRLLYNRFNHAETVFKPHALTLSLYPLSNQALPMLVLQPPAALGLALWPVLLFLRTRAAATAWRMCGLHKSTPGVTSSRQLAPGREHAPHGC